MASCTHISFVNNNGSNGLKLEQVDPSSGKGDSFITQELRDKLYKKYPDGFIPNPEKNEPELFAEYTKMTQANADRATARSLDMFSRASTELPISQEISQIALLKRQFTIERTEDDRLAIIDHQPPHNIPNNYQVNEKGNVVISSTAESCSKDLGEYFIAVKQANAGLDYSGFTLKTHVDFGRQAELAAGVCKATVHLHTHNGNENVPNISDHSHDR